MTYFSFYTAFRYKQYPLIFVFLLREDPAQAECRLNRAEFVSVCGSYVLFSKGEDKLRPGTIRRICFRFRPYMRRGTEIVSLPVLRVCYPDPITVYQILYP